VVNVSSGESDGKGADNLPLPSGDDIHSLAEIVEMSADDSTLDSTVESVRVAELVAAVAEISPRPIVAEISPNPTVAAVRRFTGRDDAWPMVMATVSILLLLLAGAVIAVGLLASQRGIELGGPDPKLTAWELQHAQLYGFTEVTNYTGLGVTVCVVDSGIDLTHPDLNHLSLLGWKDFISGQVEPYDDQGHGTSMAGIIVASGGLSGYAAGVDLLVAKAMNNAGEGEDQIIADAVDWCVSEGSDIISLSLGGAAGFSFLGTSTDELEQSVQSAIDDGVFVVAAAGNDGEDDDGDVESPGSVENVICVGGATRLGTVWSGSSRGDNNGRLFPPMFPRSEPDQKPELLAAGHEVPILIASATGSPTGAFWGWSSGTSAATAQVSAAIAILLEAAPELKHDGTEGGPAAIDQVKIWIQNTSAPLEGQSGHDNHAGYGRLRIDRMVENATASSS